MLGQFPPYFFCVVAVATTVLSRVAADTVDDILSVTFQGLRGGDDDLDIEFPCD